MNSVFYMYIIHINIYIYAIIYIHIVLYNTFLTVCIPQVSQFVRDSWGPDQAGGFGVGECLSGNVADGGGRGAKWLIGWSWATKEHCGLIMV